MIPKAESFESYLPALLRRHIAAEPGALGAPWQVQLHAAVLFADVSGFTALAERLGEQGPAGTELLCKRLDDVFEQLIGLITAYGGDVVKFAGDAVLALWPTEEHGAREAVRLAAASGLAFQAALVAQPATEDVRLSARVAVGLGALTMSQVGGHDGRWELLFGGAPLTDLAAAEADARPGEVVLTRPARAALGEIGHGLDLSAFAWRLEALVDRHPREEPPAPLPPVPPEALSAYLPATILARLRAGQGRWLAEMRQVTVLFVNLPGLGDNTGTLEQLQLVMATMQDALTRFEGTVNKLGQDDKGVSMVAVMGLPPLAHEDDAVRGVMAALTVQARLRELDVTCAIGVASGLAFCGEIGNAQRREYTVIGRIVNLAARLMQATPDIYCDGATMRLARQRLDFEALPAQRVKGIAEPVPIFRPLVRTRRHGPVDMAPLGRDAELTVIKEALEALTERRQGGVILLEGEAGMGKSLLLAELAGRAGERGVTCLLGEADALVSTTAYQAWRPVFATLIGAEALAGEPAARREAVLAFVAQTPELLPLAPLLEVVLPIDLEDSAFTARLAGQARADATRDMLVRLLAAVAAREPLLVVLEDAHWMDSASWTLAAVVEQQVPGVLLALSLRTGEPLFGESNALLGAARLHWMRLEALAPAALTALVCRRLGVSKLPEPVEALIHERAAGHPFFGEELANALRDAGVLSFDEGECQLAVSESVLHELALPQTIQGVITRRIDRLTPAEQLTLKVASVIGRSFEYRLLHDVYPIPGDRPHLEAMLADLELHEFTQVDRPSAEPGYLFRHMITRDVVYDLMLFAQRRTLHREVAVWYEQAYDGDLAPLYPRLAHHWREADEPASALRYLVLAAERALLTFANREALGLISQAAALVERVDEPDRPPELARRLGAVEIGACAALGDLDRALARASDRIALHAADAAWARGMHASLLIRQGRFVAAIASIDEGLADQATDKSSAGWLAAHRIDCHYRQGEFREAVDLATRQLATSDGDDAKLQAFLIGMSGLAAVSLGDPAGARQSFEEQLAINQATGDLYGTAMAFNNLGKACQQMDALEEAWVDYSRGLEVASRIGDLRLQAMMTNNLGAILLEQQKPQLARGYFERALASHRNMHNRNGEAIALCNLGELCHNMGDLVAAQAYTLESVEALVGIGANGLLGEALCLLARIKLDQGAPRRALELAERAHALGEETAQPMLLDKASDLITRSNTALQSQPAT